MGHVHVYRMAGNFLCHRLCLKSQHTCFFEEKKKREKEIQEKRETRWERGGGDRKKNREGKGRMRKMERKIGENIREKKGRKGSMRLTLESECVQVHGARPNAS